MKRSQFTESLTMGILEEDEAILRIDFKAFERIAQTSGDVISRTTYTAFGEERDTWGVESPTDYGYTGQRSYVDSFGLQYFVARWYDAQTAHFTQADSIIPNPGNSMDWNRYAYVNYNPVNFNDPTGHYSDSDIQKFLQHDSSWWSYSNYSYGNGTQYDLGKQYGVGGAHDNISPGGGATCALRNSAKAAGLNPHDVYYSFSQDDMGLPNSWWSKDNLAYFINNNSLFSSWSAEEGALTDFFDNNNHRFGHFGSSAEYIKKLLSNGQRVMGMIRADDSPGNLGYPLPGNTSEDHNHWVTITNMSSDWDFSNPYSEANIITYYDSMSDTEISVSWYDFYYSWDPTDLHVVILTRDK